MRVISATNADLLQDIKAGRFREDLYYRLNVIELRLPPLNERQDDIIPLINYFLPNREFGIATEQALVNYPWPGNVRELENACKRAGVLKPQGQLNFTDFGLEDSVSSSKKQVSKEPDKAEIEAAMREYHGVVAKVARHFGLSRQALYRRLQKFEIDY